MSQKHIRSIIFALGAMFALSIFALFGINLNTVTQAQPTSPQSDLLIQVDSILELKLSTCNSINNSLVEVNIEPSIEGTFKSNCQEVFINTNAPGYSLSTKASSTTLDYINPTSLNPKPTINPTTNTTTAPNTLTNDTWGFAVEGKPNFDTTYTIDNANNKYAALSTADIPIYQTDIFPPPETNHKFYYAAKLTPSTMAGGYQTIVTYTATPELPTPPPNACRDTAPECISFTVDVADTGTYSIPTSGRVANMDHTYDWNVYVDNSLTNACPNGNCIGTSSISSNGITLTNLSNGQHTIEIVPREDPIPGWGNAFGHYTESEGANTAINKNKLITLNSPLTTMAFSPKVSESATNASYMFASIFYGCSSLTTSATIIDTYKLPNSITQLHALFGYIHRDNTSLTKPINIVSLDNWINRNESIVNLSHFLTEAHFNNINMQSAIDLNPLSNWFRFNTSITNLSGFINSVHSFNVNIRVPVDMKPISGWFNANNSITSLSSFLNSSHNRNTNLQYPIDLSPIASWFNANTSVNLLNFFLAYTHYDNRSLDAPIDMTTLSGWFSSDSPVISSLLGFMYQTHGQNISLLLDGQKVLPNWMKTMSDGSGVPIWNVGTSANDYSFYRTFYLGHVELGDTGEVKFEDGTVLSSVGEPNNNRETYNGRSGLTILNNSNGRWKN